MIIHALGVDKCVVVVKLWCFYDLCENGLKLRSLIFVEFEWINRVVMMD